MNGKQGAHIARNLSICAILKVRCVIWLTLGSVLRIRSGLGQEFVNCACAISIFEIVRCNQIAWCNFEVMQIDKLHTAQTYVILIAAQEQPVIKIW